MNDQSRLGQQYGKYLITRQIGAGGFSEVFEARHRDTHEPYAIKVDTENDPDRLGREFDALQQIDHVGIVKAIDFGVCERNHEAYLALELLNGPNLSVWYRQEIERLRKEQPTKKPSIPILVALETVHKIADALTAVHGTWLHRDVKPRNVIITDDRICLVDFGIARPKGEVAPRHDLTMGRGPIGSRQYMPREQWLDPKNLTPCADLFSLGGVLFFLLTGSAPFNSEGSLHHEFPAILDHRQTSSQVVRLLEMVSATQAGDRCQSATEFRDATKACIDALQPEDAIVYFDGDLAGTTHLATTEHPHQTTALSEALRSRPAIVREEPRVGDKPVARLAVSIVEPGQSIKLADVAAFAEASLQGACIAFDGKTITLTKCLSYATITTASEEGRAMQRTVRPMSPIDLPVTGSPSVHFFNRSRGESWCACAVTAVSELQTTHSILVGFDGALLKFTRLSDGETIGHLLVAIDTHVPATN